jgi:hypothetical protein
MTGLGAGAAATLEIGSVGVTFTSHPNPITDSDTKITIAVFIQHLPRDIVLPFSLWFLKGWEYNLALCSREGYRLNCRAIASSNSLV